MSVIRIVFAILIIVAVLAFIVAFVKSLMGKPFGKTLNVPKGPVHVKVDVYDDRSLRPFRYSQAFDVVFTQSEQTLTSIYTGAPRSGVGVVTFKGDPVGFVDEASSYARTLLELAARYPKVILQVAVMGTDADGRPDVELLLPEAKWFVKALKESAGEKA